MSYGFEARNAANEVVIDTAFPVYELGSPATIVSGSPNSNATAWSFPQPPAGVLRFWQLNVGDGISASPNAFIGSKQTFTVRDVVLASSLPNPTGYGMAIFNSSGQRIYASNGELLTIGDKYNVVRTRDTIGPSINVSDQWVAIESFKLTILSNETPGGGGFGLSLTSGVARRSSTELGFYGVPFATAPEVLILNPCTFITAK